MAATTAIYCRISDDRDDLRLGVGRQEDDCRRMAADRGWNVIEPAYVDNDISAADPRKQRPEYRRLLDDIAARRIKNVIVWDLDRLVRQPIELEEFSRSGVRNLITVSGDVDFGTGNGMLVARIKGAVAAEEITKLRARCKRKKLELAQDGKPSGGGSRPFGYGKDRKTVRQAEADEVRKAVAHLLAGGSLRSIAIDWNARGVKTTRGNPWSTKTVRQVLVAPRISGEREHLGEIIGDAIWPGLIDKATGAKVRAVLGDPARNTRGAPVRRYLLSGFLRCGKCGKLLRSHPDQKRQRTYICPSGPNLGCGSLRIVGEPLEDLVVEALFLRLDSPGLAASIEEAASGGAGRDLTDELAADRAQLDQLAREWANKNITMSEWSTARKVIEARLEAAERSLTRLARTDALTGLTGPGLLRKAWPGLDFDRRRTILATVIEQVVIAPSATPGRKTFDPSRVDIRWLI